MTDIRTTREAIEVLASVTEVSASRVTRIAIEVLTSESVVIPVESKQMLFSINFI